MMAFKSCVHNCYFCSAGHNSGISVEYQVWSSRSAFSHPCLQGLDNHG